MQGADENGYSINCVMGIIVHVNLFKETNC